MAQALQINRQLFHETAAGAPPGAPCTDKTETPMNPHSHASARAALASLAARARRPLSLLAGVAATAAAVAAFAHGNVTPQAIDTTGLAPLGEEWRLENPYKGNPRAIEIGSSGYNQNCARCHGLEVISGGIAPDLRKLENDCATMADAGKRVACVKEIDEYFITTVRHGRSRNGAVYMPPFEGAVSQEALWAIKSYLETRREKAF